MALIDKASLLMVPSVYEDGTLYNVLPSGNKAPDETGNHNGYDQTRADFTFSRGSNLAATRVNANGLIEKGRENLLTYSNDFSNAVWYKVNTSVTSGQPDKDGGTDAWLLSKSAASAQVYNDESGNISTFSIYAKEGTIGGIRLVISTSSTFDSADFDLTNGVLGSVGSVIDANIESVGNGWYRCSIVGGQVPITRLRIYPITSGGDASGTTGSIYIQSAQLEKGLVATDYIETGATTATAGILENTPRIDYSSGAGALLLEPQRTNAITQSEYFGDSSWSKSGMTLTTNTSDTKSPEGVYNATHIEATNTDPYLLAFPSVTTGDVTFSIYVKAIGDAVGRACSIHLDYNFGTATGTNATQGFNAPSDWTRFDVTGNCTASGTVRVRAELGNAATIGDDFYIFGAQVESSASYPSSYVPTYGSAATRGADDCEKQGIGDVVGINEMSFLIEATPLMESNASNPPIFLTLTNNDGQTNICYLQMKTNNEIRFDYYVGGVQQFRITSGVNVLEYGTKFKAAIAIKDNDCVLYVNGTQIGADTSGSTTNLFNQINCGTYVTDTYTGGSVQQLAIFNERLSNTELATLTTL